MESLAECDDTLFAGVERRQLHGVFIGLGARVDEKQLVVVVATGLAELLCQTLLKAVDDGIAVEHQVLGLVLQRFHVVGVAVAHRNHGMAAVEVEIFSAVAVESVASTSFHYLNVE